MTTTPLSNIRSEDQRKESCHQVQTPSSSFNNKLTTTRNIKLINPEPEPTVKKTEDDAFNNFKLKNDNELYKMDLEPVRNA